MITINLDKAKTISHTIRREKRTEEFQPLDEAIMKQIPGTDLTATETARQTIREKYHAIQISIDDAQNSDELLTIVKNMV
jgi:hypothetical protein